MSTISGTWCSAIQVARREQIARIGQGLRLAIHDHLGTAGGRPARTGRDWRCVRPRPRTRSTAPNRPRTARHGRRSPAHNPPPARIFRTSASDSSRASVTRETPKLCASRTPSALVMLIWVLPWISRSGAICLAILTMPRSCTMMASAPASAMPREGALRFRQLVIEDQCVEGYKPLHAAPVQRPHDFRQFGQGKADFRASREVVQAEIHRVRACFDGRAELWPVSGRAHDFRFALGKHTEGTTFRVTEQRR